MILYVLNKSYETVDIIDTYVELIWADRFRECGDFELYLPVNYCVRGTLAKGNYLHLPKSDHYMIIEDSTTTTQPAGKGDPSFKLIGRSLESILDRRIIWPQIDYSGTVHGLIKRILTENVIDPSMTNRKISNFTFTDSSGGRMDEYISAQYHGENVKDVIESLCSEYNLGYRVRPQGSGGFDFTLYSGEDRSYSQETNPWVVFGPKYENIADTTLAETNSKYRNTAMMFNEYQHTYQVPHTDPDTGETTTESVTELVRSEVEVFNKLGSVSGLDRKEIFINSNISHNDANGNYIDPSLYRHLMSAEGKKELEEYTRTSAFIGSCETYRQFVLGRDFNLGDIVSIENEYGQKGRCRVIEVIYSSNKNGESILPTFENADDTKITT